MPVDSRLLINEREKNWDKIKSCRRTRITFRVFIFAFSSSSCFNFTQICIKIKTSKRDSSKKKNPVAFHVWEWKLSKGEINGNIIYGVGGKLYCFFVIRYSCDAFHWISLAITSYAYNEGLFNMLCTLRFLLRRKLIFMASINLCLKKDLRYLCYRYFD